MCFAQGGHANVLDFVNIPVSIVLGIILGAVTGYGLYLFFETAYARKHCVRNSIKVIIVLGFSFLLVSVEGWLEGKISLSGLLAVVSMACVIAYLPKAMLMYGKEASNRKQEVDRQHHTIPKQKPNDRIVESLFPCIF